MTTTQGTTTAATGSGHSTATSTKKNHKKRGQTTGRAKLIRSMRAAGDTYQDIRDTLGIAARDIEAVLGEVAELHAQGHTHGDIGDLVGLPRTTVQRLLRGKGRRRMSVRANTAAALVVDMYGIQLDVLADLLSMDLSHTRVLARQLQAAKLMLPDLIGVQLGEKWLVPTKETAGSYLGWMPRTQWLPPNKDAEHYRAVAMARAILVGSDISAWVSERQLRHDAESASYIGGRRSREVGHIHDGRFLGVVDGTYGWWALEVELTQKNQQKMDLALQGAIRAARDADPEPMIGLLYLCRGARVHRTVEAAMGRLPRELRNTIAFAFGDLDEEWKKHRATRRRMKAATRTPNPNHQRGRRRTRASSEENQ